MIKKEPKFSQSEIAQKQREALEMDQKAQEIIDQGEAKTHQEAVEKIEEKELEKAPEEMLKHALPLSWERALENLIVKEANSEKFLKEKIKKRIDLAKKYNLETEHFFYDPEKLEKDWIQAKDDLLNLLSESGSPKLMVKHCFRLNLM